jgi:hypothetical protein
MTQFAKTVTLFLVDGTSDGLRKAQMSRSDVLCLAFGRELLSDAIERWQKYTERAGVYILAGKVEGDESITKLYVGQGDSVARRLISHSRIDDKPFWQDTIVLSCTSTSIREGTRSVRASDITSGTLVLPWRRQPHEFDNFGHVSPGAQLRV